MYFPKSIQPIHSPQLKPNSKNMLHFLPIKQTSCPHKDNSIKIPQISFENNKVSPKNYQQISKSKQQIQDQHNLLISKRILEKMSNLKQFDAQRKNVLQDLSILSPKPSSRQLTPTNQKFQFKEFANISGIKYIKKRVIHQKTKSMQTSSQSPLSSPTKAMTKKNYSPLKYQIDSFLSHAASTIKLPITKVSLKPIGKINCYAATTHQGIFKDVNEDRISIILNIGVPPTWPSDKPWPACSFFAIYDGHGSSLVSNFLKDNLHHYIINDQNFPSNIPKAITMSVEKIEQLILNKSLTDIKLQRSGSCSLVCLIFNSVCFIANTGDSRAISSKQNLCSQLTIDHKPNYFLEKARIISNNGTIYRLQLIFNFNIYRNEYTPELAALYTPEEIPYRVFPGKLSVSRTIGDAQAKIKQFGGLPGVVIATPEIFQIELDDQIEFIILGSLHILLNFIKR